MSKKEMVKGGDNVAPLTASRGNFFQSKQKEKIAVENQENWKYESNVNRHSNERFATKDPIESLQTDSQVGAIAVSGTCGGMIDLDETELPDSRLSMTHTSQHTTSLEISGAQVVDDVVINAIPEEDFLVENDVQFNVNAVPKKGPILKYRLIVLVSMLLLAGIIISVVILTGKSPSDSPDVDLAANGFLENLKILLTNASRQELEVPDSVPNIALDWLLNRSNFNVYSFHRQVQQFAMAAFFISLQGKSWDKNQGWLSEDDECNWYQSSDETVCVNGTLRVLSLENNTLNGLLPDNIALLSSLSYLNLGGNKLTRTIPSSIEAMSNLTYLNLAVNELSSSIPSEFGQCTKLTMMDLSSNTLVGSIPSEIGQCTKLTELSLRQNSLDGPIPREISQSTKLTELDLSSNSLGGSIPSEIGHCMKLELLALYENFLYGSIPSEIGALTNLEYLDLSSNNLRGTIPSEIGQCTKLTELRLYFNSLDGSIPSEIGKCTGLIMLALSSNTLSGTIPSEIGALTKLKGLYIIDNTLSGTIPESLCNQGLEMLVDENNACSCCN